MSQPGKFTQFFPIDKQQQKNSFQRIKRFIQDLRFSDINVSFMIDGAIHSRMY